MKTAIFLFCLVICVKTIKCSYSTQKSEYFGQITTSNRLIKRQVDDDLGDDESNEKQYFEDLQKPAETNNGILIAHLGTLNSGILLAPPGRSSRASHLKPLESNIKKNNNNKYIASHPKPFERNIHNNKNNKDIASHPKPFERNINNNKNNKDIASHPKPFESNLKTNINNKNVASHPKPFEINIKNNNKDMKEDMNIISKCKHYKPVERFDFVLMADTWQIAYYISKDRLSCFKIRLQSTTPLKKRVWTKTYGNFNGSVKWNQCMFEMSGSEADMSTAAVPQKNYEHRHFLQGSYRDKGVFANIIIEQHPGKNATLIEQSPDQWFVYKELLLMRDCDNGEVVVFAKMTLNQPVYTNITKIEEALTNFQEPTNTGVLACNHWKNSKFRTLS